MPMNGKANMHIPYVLLRELGIDVYVVADRDAKGAQRKHPTDIGKRMKADASHKRAIEQLLSWLDTTGSSYAYADPTVVTKDGIIFEDDMEEELAQWPDFVARLAGAGGTIRSKNVLQYRSAVNDASMSGYPAKILALINALHVM